MQAKQEEQKEKPKSKFSEEEKRRRWREILNILAYGSPKEEEAK